MLSKQELRKLMKHKEDSLLERKEEFHFQDFCKAAVAFANSIQEGSHAVIFLGITDKGEIKGVPNTDKTQKDVGKAIAYCYPPIKAQTLVLKKILHNQVVFDCQPIFLIHRQSQWCQGQFGHHYF